MKKEIFFLASIFLVKFSIGQDTVLSYSRIIRVDSLSKNVIFDKALVWCSKSFNDSKSAIRVKERDGGIIGGKALYNSIYFLPSKKKNGWLSAKDQALIPKDSTLGVTFSNYFFDWLIEIKDGKLRFSASNIMLWQLDREYAVTSSTKAPYDIWLQPTAKTELDWKLSKEYFLKNLDKLINNLKEELVEKKEDW